MKKKFSQKVFETFEFLCFCVDWKLLPWYHKIWCGALLAFCYLYLEAAQRLQRLKYKWK
jgi:hypothetical protein